MIIFIIFCCLPLYLCKTVRLKSKCCQNVSSDLLNLLSELDISMKKLNEKFNCQGNLSMERLSNDPITLFQIGKIKDI